MILKEFIRQTAIQVLAAVNEVPGAYPPSYIDIETSIAPCQIYYQGEGMKTEIVISEDPDATKIKLRVQIK